MDVPSIAGLVQCAPPRTQRAAIIACVASAAAALILLAGQVLVLAPATRSHCYSMTDVATAHSLLTHGLISQSEYDVVHRRAFNSEC